MSLWICPCLCLLWLIIPVYLSLTLSWFVWFQHVFLCLFSGPLAFPVFLISIPTDFMVCPPFLCYCLVYWNLLVALLLSVFFCCLPFCNLHFGLFWTSAAIIKASFLLFNLPVLFFKSCNIFFTAAHCWCWIDWQGKQRMDDGGRWLAHYSWEVSDKSTDISAHHIRFQNCQHELSKH